MVPGWMWPRELGAIYDLASGSQRHVEIGSFCGRSLLAAAGAIAEGGHLIAIDPLSFDCYGPGDNLPPVSWVRSVFQATCDLIRERRPDITLEHVALPSLDALRTIRDVDSLLIDAQHHYAETIAEIEAGYTVLQPGGRIFGHDYWAVWPGVMEAVNEFFGTRGLEFEVIPQTRLWLHRKPG